MPSGPPPTLIGVPRAPPVVMLWTWLELVLLNQSWPLGPAVIAVGLGFVGFAESRNESLRVVSNCRDSRGSTPGRRCLPSLIALSRRGERIVEPARRR